MFKEINVEKYRLFYQVTASNRAIEVCIRRNKTGIEQQCNVTEIYRPRSISVSRFILNFKLQFS